MSSCRLNEGTDDSVVIGVVFGMPLDGEEPSSVSRVSCLIHGRVRFDGLDESLWTAAGRTQTGAEAVDPLMVIAGCSGRLAEDLPGP